VIPLSLAQIAGITGGTLDRVPDAGAVVRGPVVIDSRDAGPGGLFAALPGERVDGHDFAAAAVAAGAGSDVGSSCIGSIGLLSIRTSKWVCGPVELPVEPTRPISWPRLTTSPSLTPISSRCP